MKEVLVVKVGTSTLLGNDERPSDAFEYIAESVRQLRDDYDIVLVTSGAIGFGVKQRGLDRRPTSLHHLQALSMMGQVGLLERWREAFAAVAIGQVLITRHDLETVQTVSLFHESIRALWQYGAIPIVNENDAISTEEISFGDNDQLAAEVAVALGADYLVLLTDQDGIQSDFGAPQQQRLKAVSVTEAQAHLRPIHSQHGKGGASSKVAAAQRALEAGIAVYVAHAAHSASIEGALSGQSGTKIVN